jgi:hypothetical protein
MAMQENPDLRGVHAKGCLGQVHLVASPPIASIAGYYRPRQYPRTADIETPWF